jgi:hypothetical protein
MLKRRNLDSDTAINSSKSCGKIAEFHSEDIWTGKHVKTVEIREKFCFSFKSHYEEKDGEMAEKYRNFGKI